MKNRGRYVCLFWKNRRKIHTTTHLHSPALRYLQQLFPNNYCTNEANPLVPKSLKIVTLCPNQSNFVFKYRGYCSFVTDDDDDEEEEEEEEEEEDRADGDERERRMANPEEVDRLCKLIGESFSLGLNMEEFLDGCGIDLTHDLVLDVLERCHHAHRPAFRFFCWAGDRNVFAHDSETYNKMMQILADTKQFETMVSVLEDMGQKGLLTFETFQISIVAFAAAKQRKKVVGLFELMKKYKFKVGVQTINLLLEELGRAKLGREAHDLFKKLEHRFTHNTQTYTVLLCGWCRVKNFFEAGEIWNLMIDRSFKPDIVAHNTMLMALLKWRKISDSIKLFELMKAKGPSPNLTSYTILVRYMCKKGKMEMAMSFFREMQYSDCEPDATIYSCLIVGFVKQNKMDKVYSLLVEMKEKGYPPGPKLYHALIKLMTKRQMLDLVVQVYKKMIRDGVEPTTYAFNMMMRSFFIANNYDMASAVWEEMKRKGCCPDEDSYRLMIGELVRLRRSVEACKFLEEMIEKGMRAPQLDYKRFTADFSQIGKPDILKELAQRMKFSGKVQVSDVFARWAMKMKYRRGLLSDDDKYG